MGLSRLTEQLLNQALIIHRSDAAVRARVDLREIAARVASETDHDLMSTGENLRLDLPEEPVFVEADALSPGRSNQEPGQQRIPLRRATGVADGRRRRRCGDFGRRPRQRHSRSRLARQRRAFRALSRPRRRIAPGSVSQSSMPWPGRIWGICCSRAETTGGSASLSGCP